MESFWGLAQYTSSIDQLSILDAARQSVFSSRMEKFMQGPYLRLEPLGLNALLPRVDAAENSELDIAARFLLPLHHA